jgi:hypothetical protein
MENLKKKHPHKTKDRVTRTQLKTDIVLKNSACNVTGLDGTFSMVIQKDIVTLKIQEGYHCL